MKAISEGSVGFGSRFGEALLRLRPRATGRGAGQRAIHARGSNGHGPGRVTVRESRKRFEYGRHRKRTVIPPRGKRRQLAGLDNYAQLSVPWHGVHGRKPALKTTGELPSRVSDLLLDSESPRRPAKRCNER